MKQQKKEYCFSFNGEVFRGRYKQRTRAILAAMRELPKPKPIYTARIMSKTRFKSLDLKQLSAATIDNEMTNNVIEAYQKAVSGLTGKNPQQDTATDAQTKIRADAENDSRYDFDMLRVLLQGAVYDWLEKAPLTDPNTDPHNEDTNETKPNHEFITMDIVEIQYHGKDVIEHIINGGKLPGDHD